MGEPNRLFSPSTDPFTRLVPLSELITYNREKQISQLQIVTRDKQWVHPDKESLVIHVDGACRDNQTRARARASYGVYVGPNSCYNIHGLVSSPGAPPSSQLAEIEALRHALKDVLLSNV